MNTFIIYHPIPGYLRVTGSEEYEMANIFPITFDSGIITDQGARIDEFGQAMLLSIFSDLCQLRDREMDQNCAIALDGIAKRLGKLLERYEP